MFPYKYYKVHLRLVRYSNSLYFTSILLFIVLSLASMLLHLGLDRVILCSSLGQTIIPFQSIDMILPEILIAIYQETSPDTIYVITGPWSFTNVRVGILALDTLAMMIQSPYRLLQVDKISLYRSLRRADFLPASVLMYIGQRKNLWHYDFSQSDTHHVINGTERESRAEEDYAIDMMMGDDIILSDMVKEHHAIWWWWSDDWPYVTYREKSFDCSDFFVLTQKAEPCYAVEINRG